MAASTKPFIVFALLWEIAVGILYGLFLGYNQAYMSTQQSASTASNPLGTNLTFSFPFPLAVGALSIILLIVGFSMVAGYIEKNTITGMTFTLLIFALTVQNFFIFRNFWDKTSLPNPDASADFSQSSYFTIGYTNYGNDQSSSYKLPTASLLDAVGCAISLYAGYTAVIGRIGLSEIFFLTWIGTFLYELNELILWRLFILDNGYSVRAFAFGGALGLISSLILGKRDSTVKNNNFRSSYKIMSLSFLGIILVWCLFPILALTNTYQHFNSASTVNLQNTGKIQAMAIQVNTWLSLAASVLGCYTASAFMYRKFSVHDIIFGAITGAIAYSSSSDINFNPGAALTIGYSVGFICSLGQTKIKHWMNARGVVDSNSVVFHFLIPSFFACIFSAILSSFGQSAVTLSFNATNPSTGNTTQATFTTAENIQPGRSDYQQGGFQIIGWLISVGIGSIGGIIIGLLYKCLNSHEINSDINDFFNDAALFSYPKPSVAGEREQAKQAVVE